MGVDLINLYLGYQFVYQLSLSNIEKSEWYLDLADLAIVI